MPTEIELLQKMVDGLKKVIEAEIKTGQSVQDTKEVPVKGS